MSRRVNIQEQRNQQFSRTPTASSSSTSDDFIGPPPPGYRYSSTASSSSSSSSIANQQPPQHQRRPRKQTQPRKRKDQISKEIVRLQKTTELCIPRLPFQRLVREIIQKYSNNFRVQVTTIEALRESSEAFIVQMFEDAFALTIHRQRITLNRRDIQLCQFLGGPVKYAPP